MKVETGTRTNRHALRVLRWILAETLVVALVTCTHAQAQVSSNRIDSAVTAEDKTPLTRQLKRLKKAFRPDISILREQVKSWETGYQPVHWKTIRPAIFESTAGAHGRILDDGSILVVGNRGDKDSYHLEFRVDEPTVTGIRVEAIPDASLPCAGSGRGDQGEFVLTDIQVSASARRRPRPDGRFLRVELPGESKEIMLAEVHVFSSGENIAASGSASQSSTTPGFAASLAIDGNAEDADRMSTTDIESNPWWELDLQRRRKIDRIVIWNAPYSRHVQRRLNGLRVSILDENRTPIWSQTVQDAEQRRIAISPTQLEPVRLSNPIATRNTGQLFGITIPSRTPAANSSDDLGLHVRWKVTQHSGVTEAAAFAAECLRYSDGFELSLDLNHQQGQGQLLGRFRISVCQGPQPLSVLPDAVASAMVTPIAERTELQRAELQNYVHSVHQQTAAAESDAEWARAELSKRIQHSMESGEFQRARAWAEEHFQLCCNIGAGPNVRADAALKLAQLRQASGNFDEAAATLTTILTAQESAQDREDWYREDAKVFLEECRMAEAEPLSTEWTELARCRLRSAALVSSNPNKAVAHAKSGLAISRRVHGESGRVTAHHCLQLGAGLVAQKKYQSAAVTLERGLKMLPSELHVHPAVAGAYQLLSICRQNSGELRKAYRLQRHAADLYAKVCGADHFLTASARMRVAHLCNEVASTYEDVVRAIQDVNGATSFYEKHRSRFPDDLAEACHLSGRLNNSIGQSQQAMDVLEKALYYYQRCPTVRSESLGHVYSMLGSAYDLLNRNYEARRDWERALKYAEDQNDLMLVAECCTKMGRYYVLHGEYAAARPMLERSLSVLRQSGAEQSTRAAYCLMILGQLQAETNELREAEATLRDASLIFAEQIPDGSTDSAVCLGSLGSVQRRLGKIETARENLDNALAMTRVKVGERSPNFINQAIEFSRVLEQQGNERGAEELLLSLQQLARKNFDRMSATRQQIARALGLLYAHAQRGDEALDHFRDALEIRLRGSANTLPALSEAEAVAYQRQTMATFEEWFATARPGSERAGARDVYQLLWQTRGLVTREQIRRRRLCRSTPELADAYEQLRRSRRDLTNLHGNGAAVSWSAEWREALAQLSQRKELFERQVADHPRVVKFHENRKTGNAAVISKLMAALPSETAMVEFIKYLRAPNQRSKPAPAEWHYDAFVVRPVDSAPGYRVVWLELGRADYIDTLIEQWRRKLCPEGLNRGLARSSGDSSEGPEKVLRKLLWEPIERELNGCTSVVLIPDSDLCRVPWPALPGRQAGTFLIERFKMVTASHGRQLYDTLTRPQANNRDVLLLGGVDYGSAPQLQNGSHNSVGVGTASGWKPLAHSGAEVEAISKHWKGHNVTLLTKERATEQRLLSLLSKQRIVHLASHGYFADQLYRVLNQSDDSDRISIKGFLMPRDRGTVSTRNPFLLSGLVLANANAAPALNNKGLPVGADCLLTAEEVIDLDLHQVDLVTLSSCETGLGNIVGGEGVFGLQRAFHVAGVRSVISSLWPVHDRATRLVMTEFHRRLSAGNVTRIDALREAQLAMLRGKLDPSRKSSKPRSVHEWAGWMLSGDWR